MKQRRILREIIIIAISIIVTWSISINLNKDTNMLDFVNGNSFIWIICTLYIYHILNEVLLEKDKRLLICAIILGIILSSFSVIGNSINTYLNLSGIISSKTTIFKSIIKWFGFFVLISSTLIILFEKLNKLIEKLKNSETLKSERKSKLLNFFTNNRKSFIICWIIIFLAWIPFFLKYYPGIVTPDSVDQIKQALGLSKINSHHPLLHTIIIKFAMILGITINNQNTGIAIYSIIQMLIMSGFFSFTIYYMAKKDMPVWVRITTIIFFAIYPVNAMYSITMWKNILSSGAILLFMICMTEISTNQEKFLNSKLKIIALVIISLLIVYLLNNGIYIIILTIPFLFIQCKKSYKIIICIVLIILITYFVINTILFSVLKIQKGSIREALSIPLQQFARVVKYRESDLNEEEKQIIHNLFTVEDLGSLYNPTLSDPVKSVFNQEYFDKNKMEFIITWIKLFFRFPLEYVESFLCNCYGYWYPEATNWVVSRALTQDEMLDIIQEPKVEGKVIGLIDSLIDKRDIPVVSMFFSLGFMFWLILISLTYCIYKKNYNLILIYVPILVLWLTVIASPVFCEYRYLYGMVTSLPILLTTPLLVKEKVKKERNKIWTR